MSKKEELERFKTELEKQLEKGNEGNINYCRLNIARLEKEIAAQQPCAVDTPSALCPKCGLPLIAGLGCIDCD